MRVIVYLYLFLSMGICNAQGYGTLADWKERVEVRFDKVTGFENTGLLRGVEYRFPPRGSTTHPFLVSQGGDIAKVEFKNGDHFENVPLVIDLYQNQIAIRYLRQSGHISLIRMDVSKIKSILIFDRNFSKFLRDGKEDFYEILFERDNCLLVARRKKVVKIESLSQFEYDVSDEFYWISDKNWYELGQASDFIGLAKLQHREKELRQLLKDQNIKLKRRSEADMKRVAEFYCSAL